MEHVWVQFLVIVIFLFFMEVVFFLNLQHFYSTVLTLSCIVPKLGEF